MLWPDGVKDKKYCGFHDRNSHSINGCRVFRMRIQKAIQEEHLKFDNKMKLDGNPVPQNMIGFSINMVNVVEENRNMRVCIDFRDRNRAKPMDGYQMPVADLLIDAAVRCKVISFMDGNAGYNQIFMAVEDVAKTSFRCPGHIGLFEWIVMTFGLKNAGATFQRAMNNTFHELIGKVVEIYINDVVIKSLDHESHLTNVKKTLECTRKHGLKMNRTNVLLEFQPDSSWDFWCMREE
jgi:hypothetical protein